MGMAAHQQLAPANYAWGASCCRVGTGQRLFYPSDYSLPVGCGSIPFSARYLLSPLLQNLNPILIHLLYIFRTKICDKYRYIHRITQFCQSDVDSPAVNFLNISLKSLHFMLCFLVCASFCTVTVDTSKHFHTFSTSSTETYQVTPGANELVFFFVQNTADSVLLTIGYSTTPTAITPPYALAVSQSARVNVTTSRTASVVVMVVQNNVCKNGAFYVTGGKQVKVEANPISLQNEAASFCLFSPSTDDQSLEVEYGIRDYSDWGGDSLMMVYRNLDGHSEYEYCQSKKNRTCTRTISHAHYYVAYERGRFSGSRKMYYRRQNRDHEDLYANCTSRMIPYYPVGSGETPYDIDSSSWYCHNQEEYEKNKKINTIIGAVIGVVLIVVAIGILVKTKCCATCRVTEQETVNSSLMPGAEETYPAAGYPPQTPYGYPPAANNYGAQPYPYQARPSDTTVYA